MATFKLPVPENLGDNDKTIDYLIDIMHKYRKELQWLLYNLDEENMPQIGQFMEDAAGNFSSIIQTAENIELQVGNMDGRVSTLELTADGLTSDVSALGTIVVDHNELLVTHSSQISQNATSISAKLNINDFTAAEISLKLSNTTTTAKIRADNIHLEGIVRVANHLTLGQTNQDGSITFKSGAVIDSGVGVAGIRISASDFAVTDGNITLGRASSSGYTTKIIGALDLTEADVTGINVSGTAVFG